jgi:hypothetical protein
MLVLGLDLQLTSETEKSAKDSGGRVRCTWPAAQNANIDTFARVHVGLSRALYGNDWLGHELQASDPPGVARVCISSWLASPMEQGRQSGEWRLIDLILCS